MTTSDLELRLARIEANTAIDHRMSSYLRSCDIDKDVDDIVAHFTPDAIWEGVGRNVSFGRAQGREAIAAHFATVFTRQPFTLHYIANTIIDVDAGATSGRGRWMCIEPTAIRNGTLPAWVGLDYDVTFTLTDRAWLISHLQVDTLFASPYHIGWVADRFTDMTATEPYPGLDSALISLPNTEGAQL
ncbi:nuclear transport factor 2 family protein [Gordonia sp. zg691]|uniref:nuclear transport factor 2 family protein n=1 Tax=Gordonia jinghuaiqii TaxID=2758710 RepID=UPI0016623193|nr:nuclear transport factor 2 family protein [Gordonia jinghuaiqii]MBD0861931.1 nuclear transport factor 2 family protein [Gordonia jinghuaiqii]